jgi:ABC-2 type transport system permease protein
MRRFFAATHKELLLLKRDRSGLLVLFVMPAILVLVITLVQENAMKTMGENPTDILFIDDDGDMVGRQMEKSLSEAVGVHLTKELNGRRPEKAEAIGAVAGGEFQLCLFIPEGMTAAVKKNARIAAAATLSIGPGEEAPPPTEVEVYFDPTVMGGFRSAVTHLLKLMIFSIEVEEKIAALSALLPEKLKKETATALGPMAHKALSGTNFKMDLKWSAAPLIKLRDDSAKGRSPVTPQNAVQQNVPAWALFGVFFIVLPMAGSFIKERLCGARYRLLSLPVSYLTLVAGKLCAYMMVCLIQFALILCIGKWLLPLLGTPAFEMGGTPLAAAAVALSAIGAATGYGILMGTLVNSYEQASMFGALSIVIAAAVGGIMVPVYAMPAMMQKISVISPLAWAQNAFLDIFVRGGNFQSVLPHVTALIIFALACIITSWVLFDRQVR